MDIYCFRYLLNRTAGKKIYIILGGKILAKKG